MLLSTRSRSNRPVTKSAFSTQTPSLTTKLAFSAATSKNFRLRRHELPLRGRAGAYRHPPQKQPSGPIQVQYARLLGPWRSALKFQSLRRQKKANKNQKLSQGRLSCCRCAELLNSLGASDVESKSKMTSCGVSPAANRTRTCRMESVCCSHGVRLSAARTRAYASARVRFLLCSRSHFSSIPKFSGLRRCGFAPEARNFLGTRHAEKMVASMTFMTSKSSRIVVSKVYGVNTDVKCAILVTIMQS